MASAAWRLQQIEDQSKLTRAEPLFGVEAGNTGFRCGMLSPLTRAALYVGARAIIFRIAINLVDLFQYNLLRVR